MEKSYFARGTVLLRSQEMEICRCCSKQRVRMRIIKVFNDGIDKSYGIISGLISPHKWFYPCLTNIRRFRMHIRRMACMFA